MSKMQDSSFPHSRRHAAKPRFQCWEEVDVEHHFNTENDRVWPKNGGEGFRVVARKQCPASVMVWAAVTESGRSPLFCWSRGEIKPTKLLRWHPCWCIIALGTRALQKTSLVFSAGLCTITWAQKDSEVTFRECSALHYQRGTGPMFTRSESSGFWNLVVPWEQGLDRSPSKLGSPNCETAEGVGQNLSKSHSWLE